VARNQRIKNRNFYQRNRVKIWYGLLIFVMLFSFAVLGPLAQEYLIDAQKPYILVDLNQWMVVLKDASYKTCDVPPFQPVELTGNPSGKVEKFYMDSVPMEWLPYVKYPPNWNQWWNIFNPEQPFGPTVKTVLMWVTPALAIWLIIWGIMLWRKGKLKDGLRRLLPHDD
jgi:hypothetical protein